MDTLSSSQRSERMSRVRSIDSKPELQVRRLLHSLGYRFRLHRRELPGSPDLVFPSRKKVIFVHGCYWHRHDERHCPLTRTPKSKLDFWQHKFAENQRRDARVQTELEAKGWRWMVAWECELRHGEQLKNALVEFLEG